MDEIGPYIREMRVATGRSQTDVATAVGITRPYLTRIELGKANPSTEVILTILEEIGSPARLVFETPYP